MLYILIFFSRIDSVDSMIILKFETILQEKREKEKILPSVRFFGLAPWTLGLIMTAHPMPCPYGAFIPHIFQCIIFFSNTQQQTQ